MDINKEIILKELYTEISGVKSLRYFLINKKTYDIIGTCFIDDYDLMQPIIHTVFIKEDFRGNGYSKILLDIAHQYLKESNTKAEYVYLFVDKDDYDLRMMYKNKYCYFLSGENTPEGHFWMQRIL